MDQNEVLERLKSIVTEYLPPPEPIIPMPPSILPPLADACWVDGNKCPYGLPNGRFKDRPVNSCHTGEGGCKKLADIKIVDELLSDTEIEIRIKTAVEKEKVSLSSELIIISKDQFPKGPERETLILAAEIIQNQCDEDIVRVDDI